MASTAATRLRRLRWLLTLLFTVTNALGLVVFAALAVRADAAQGRQQLDGELRRVTVAAIQRITFEHDAVSLTSLNNSGLTGGCPGFVVLPGGAEPAFLGLESRGGCVTAALAVLNGAAVQAVRTGKVVVGYVTDGRGRAVRMLAEPFYHGGVAAGAVVATLDAQPEASRHGRMLLLTAGGCGILVAGLALAGHVVSGRAIQPAANTLEQQELLLAETAHDLRTPVAALRALAEAALDNPDQRADLLPRTVGLAQRMGGIIDDLLVRARLAAGVERLTLQPARLDQLVAGVIENTPTDDGAQVELTATESTVYADPALLQRAIGNLLDNALRHGRRPGEAALVHVTVADGRVVVADSGPGVSKEVGGAAFDRFTTGAGSSGLGLSIVRWIADAHDGTLTVRNPPAGGAIFELALRPIPQ
ncbi:MAG: sensor histidine kinase [Pseudonocardiales bacterium]|nr:MAG: sensor histidine kinase [Pseudonocardiales bacterium]